MSVQVKVLGADKSSDEYVAATKMKEIIDRSLPNTVSGEIVLYASATLIGQAVKDVDLVMLGELSGYIENLEFNLPDMDGERVIGQKSFKKDVLIKSFCTAIEIKGHDISGVYRQGTDFYVKYGKTSHCVTEQSNKQKIAAKSFFERTISYSPYVTNLIWFTQVTPNELNELLSTGDKLLPSNVLGSDFSFGDVMQLLVLQKNPYATKRGFVFDSFYGGGRVEDFQKALNLFSQTKKQMGELTRQRIEMITSKTFSSDLLNEKGNKAILLRGRAGTGKTVGLIQKAIQLVDEQQARVLLLTYNKALVSDIKRLFALAELPDMFETHCVHINTMQSYYYHLTNCVLYEGRMSGEKFITNYERILKEMLEFLSDEEGKAYVQEMVLENDQLNWDYVLIDEAQDWTAAERDLILNVFIKEQIIIADGGTQFVRGEDSCDWTIIRDRANVKLKYCLRQKENIVAFLNTYAKTINPMAGKILSSKKASGGKVIIIKDSDLFETHREEMARLKDAGNIAYDMLYLVPHALVSKTDGVSQFRLATEFLKEDILFWDGTRSDNRSSYSTDPDEIRVLQYDSARGLEGWAVFCLDFDVFLQEKEDEYVESKADSLLLESPEERKEKYLMNWAMIPFTRAIDTLVITIKDENSKQAQLLKEISEKHPDYVAWSV